MIMKRLLLAAFVISAAGIGSAQQSEINRWWAHVIYLSDDTMQGRQTGSPEHREAVGYVSLQFRKAGLKPGVGNSYRQPVKFIMQTLDESKSSLSIVRKGAEEPVKFGDEVMLNIRVKHAPTVEAPITFIGYGLAVPESGHDDLSGQDLKGKVVVFLTGMPPGVSAPLYAHYATNRWKTLQAAGAVGGVAIQNPKGQDVPWERQIQNRLIPQMVLEDPAMDDNAGQQLAATANPAHAEKWFTGSGHTFKEILDLANAGKPLPKFPLVGTVRSVVAMGGKPVSSENVVGILPGTDPKLKDEYVVVTAHLDHLGTGNPVDGDSVFNGAMDNASGVATLIETAAAAGAKKGGFKRSLAFVAVTAEEKGLLGSRYFAIRPPIPARGIVANLNTDMFLPLFPLKSIVAQGLEESDLADDLRAIAKPLGIAVLTDPEPERNAFTRSDQFSFIRRGIPALSLKVGFTKDSPEHEIVKKWRTERYHSVRDDLSQPVDKKAAVEFNRIYVKLVEAVANRPTRPRWNDDSFFKRFAAEQTSSERPN
jgi:Zn-dependent M28 family amino/carboxypeptidase